MVLLPVDSPSSDSLTLPGHSPIVASKDMQSSPCGPLPQEQLVEEFNSSDTSEVVEAAEEADVVNDSRSSDLASLSWQEPSSPWTVEVSKQNFDILHMKLERAIFESERSLQKAEIAQNQLKVKNRTISRLEEKMEHMQHRLSHMAQLEIEIKGLNLKLMNEEDGRRTFFREAEELRQANVLLEAKLEEARECLEDALQDRILASFKLKKVEKQLNYDCNCDGKLRLKYERVRRQLDSLLSRDLMRGCFHALQHELARACQHRQRAIASGGRLQRRSLTCILAGWTEYVLMRRKKKACREVVERSVKSERAHLCLWALWLVRGQSLDQNFSAMLHSRTSRRDLQAKRAALSVWSSCTRTGYEVAKAVKHLSLHHEITLRTRQTRSHFFYLWRFTLQLDRRLQAECEHEKVVEAGDADDDAHVADG
ncbi:hypothetical protein GUITHDRAFT_99463 [Guillardia theta CCMP2712]|uniref:Uncharacterized protein n=1 Tax=Guillardia theta (strain CCMP2712) TaxID=905079 RepID=L1K2K3_GUITC|nr:hypothetical protein GUITHDRAFT_99463 [Guillardia theta CCMP2712]EKX54814.1 hypothetical protein GUITHDRAFT_99463 [Guillardia theta CCMP2712]|eukprot:XP_005841794.1 hypothetical protein GUITHDRAFT_99463 [Guillardia theta CCMP2712]